MKQLFTSRFAGYFAAVLGSLVCLLGLVVVYGWATGSLQLIKIHPSFTSMKFNTALLFVLSGSGIVLLALGRVQISRWLGMLIGLFGLLTLLQYITKINFGIDDLLLTKEMLVFIGIPGRMAPNTALNFLVAGVAITLASLGRQKRKYELVTSILSGFVLALGAVAISGYALGLDAAYVWSKNTAMAVHTAVGFCVIGSALLVINWRSDTSIELNRISPLLVPLAVILMTLNISIWIAMQLQESKQSYMLLSSRVEAKVNESASTMKELVESLSRMSKRWEVRRGTPRVEWESDAAQLMKTVPGLRSIEWVDQQYFVRWIVPLKGNEAALNLNSTTDKKRYDALLAAKNGRKMVLSHVIDLVQGGKGFLIYLPLFSGERFDGFIVGVVDVQLFFNNVFLNGYNGQTWSSIAEDGETVFNFPTDRTTEHAAIRNASKSVTLYNLNWTFSGGLTPEASQKEFSALPDIVLVTGMLIILLILSGLHFMIRNGRMYKLIQKEKTRFLMVVESAPGAMLMADREGRIEMINSQTELLFGYTREELLGMQVELLIAERYRAHHPAQREAFFEKPEARSMGDGRALVGVHKSGAEIQLEITLRPMEIEGKAKVLVSIVDTTEREKYIRELTRINHDLNQFAYIASHDLKSPLRGIDQLATWLSEDLADTIDVQTVEHLRLMRVRIKRMESLLNDLLAYSRAGRKDGEIVSVDTAELIREAFELCSFNTDFHLKLTGNFPTILSHKAPLELVFRNLLSNAIKHHDRANGQITVSIEQSDTRLEFNLADDGPGIPPEHYSRAFAMFQTLRPRDEVEGSGMGLALVKKTVEAFDGIITVSANTPRGVIFHFTWPAQ